MKYINYDSRNVIKLPTFLKWKQFFQTQNEGAKEIEIWDWRKIFKLSVKTDSLWVYGREVFLKKISEHSFDLITNEGCFLKQPRNFRN